MTRRRIHIWRDSGLLEEMLGGGWSETSIRWSMVIDNDDVWNLYVEAANRLREATKAVLYEMKEEPASAEELKELSSDLEDSDDASKSF